MTLKSAMEGRQVLLGNNKACRVQGIGKISIKMHDGCSRTLYEVRYVPELKRNLISIGVLDKSEYTIKVTREEMKISNGVMTIMRGVLESGLYIVVGNTLCLLSCMFITRQHQAVAHEAFSCK